MYLKNFRGALGVPLTVTTDHDVICSGYSQKVHGFFVVSFDPFRCIFSRFACRLQL